MSWSGPPLSMTLGEPFLCLLRVPFVRTGDSLRIITVYWTSRIEKYWEGKSPCLFLANLYEFITKLKSEGGQVTL